MDDEMKQEQAWPVLAGIDTMLARRLHNENARQYAEFLENFSREVPLLLDVLTSGTLAGHIPDCLSAIHQLCGKLGNLGAAELHVTAGDIENAIRSGNLPAAQVMSGFIQQIRGLLVDISRLPPVANPLDAEVFSNKNLDTAELREQLAALMHALRDQSADVFTLNEKLMALLGGSSLASDYRPIAAAIDRLDFVSSQTFLAEFTKKLTLKD